VFWFLLGLLLAFGGVVALIAAAISFLLRRREKASAEAKFAILGIFIGFALMIYGAVSSGPIEQEVVAQTNKDVTTRAEEVSKPKSPESAQGRTRSQEGEKENHPSARPVIPGLSWVDITLNLEKQPFGFKFKHVNLNGAYAKEARKIDPDTGAEMYVEVVYGSGVYRITASAAGINARSSASWLLPYIATVPYDGAQQAEARDWVKALLDKNQKGVFSRDFGGVTFEFFVLPPSSYILKIYPKQ